MAARDFDAASETAHTKLGMTKEMSRMCNMFENADFRTLGLQFHASADSLGEILKTQDIDKALQALQSTMAYCVKCHSTFRQ